MKLYKPLQIVCVWGGGCCKMSYKQIQIYIQIQSHFVQWHNCSSVSPHKYKTLSWIRKMKKQTSTEFSTQHPFVLFLITVSTPLSLRWSGPHPQLREWAGLLNPNAPPYHSHWSKIMGEDKTSLDLNPPPCNEVNLEESRAKSWGKWCPDR